jgi:D-glucosaminate-specific PTS system IIB component
MAEIKLIRIDCRLIHGQVVLKWIKSANANRILVVDDGLSKDAFMSKFYVQSAPAGVNVGIKSVKDAIATWKEDELGEGRIMVIFKNIETCYRLFKEGFPMDQLQIGNLPSGPGKVPILREVFLTKEEYDQIKEIHQTGARVYIQIVTEYQTFEFDSIEKKFKD